MMTADGEKIIERLKLENGMELLLYDRSRIVAGDRWLVELRCEAQIPIDESFWDLVPHGEAELPGIRKNLGDRLSFVATKQRNFIDADKREAVLNEMVEQIYDSMLEYIKRPHFPRELFKKRFNDARQKNKLQQAMDNKTTAC